VKSVNAAPGFFIDNSPIVDKIKRTNMIELLRLSASFKTVISNPKKITLIIIQVAIA
jgi:hypothetical protein